MHRVNVQSSGAGGIHQVRMSSCVCTKGAHCRLGPSRVVAWFTVLYRYVMHVVTLTIKSVETGNVSVSDIYIIPYKQHHSGSATSACLWRSLCVTGCTAMSASGSCWIHGYSCR